MKLLRSLLVALFALSFTALVFAGDASPAGSWKWTINTPNGDALEASVKLEAKDGKLTGVYNSPFGEAPISNGSFKDGVVSFDVEREFDGNKFVVKYSGKLDGDTIKGSIELPGFGGGEGSKQSWNASRSK